MGAVKIISNSLLVQGDVNRGCYFKISSEIFCDFPRHTLPKGAVNHSLSYQIEKFLECCCAET